MVFRGAPERRRCGDAEKLKWWPWLGRKRESGYVHESGACLEGVENGTQADSDKDVMLCRVDLNVTLYGWWQ